MSEDIIDLIKSAPAMLIYGSALTYGLAYYLKIRVQAAELKEKDIRIEQISEEIKNLQKDTLNKTSDLLEKVEARDAVLRDREVEGKALLVKIRDCPDGDKIALRTLRDAACHAIFTDYMVAYNNYIKHKKLEYGNNANAWTGFVRESALPTITRWKNWLRVLNSDHIFKIDTEASCRYIPRAEDYYDLKVSLHVIDDEVNSKIQNIIDDLTMRQ